MTPDTSNERRPTLELDPERMRRLGYAVVDRVVERWTRLRDLSPVGIASREEMEARLREPPPDTGRPIEEILERFWRDVEPYAGRIDHPRFLAFIPSSPTWTGVLADWLAAGCNFFQGTWLASAGPSQVEIVVIDWLKEWFGLPDTAAGLLTSGGSAANLLGLAVAREALLEGVPGNGTAYCSTDTHTAVDRAMRLLGFPRDRLRRLPAAPDGTLVPEEVRRRVKEDRGAGLQPFCVIANAGTTNRGAADPMDALADLCEREGLWLHVDGAYGAVGWLAKKGRETLRGLPRADSLVLDPHKWLYVGFEAGCLLVRRGELLRRTFQVRPDYLQDIEMSSREVNFADLGLQLTRRARALKIWASLLAHGRAAVTGEVERTIRLAELAEERIREQPGLEVAAPACLGVVCFRYVGTPRLDDDAADELNEAVVHRIQAEGRFLLSSTRLGGRYVLRLCPMNYRTTESDVHAAIDEVRRVADDLRGASPSKGGR